jgi:hypothetical protein
LRLCVYLAVASPGGAPTHPLWYYNFKAHPLVELRDGAAKGDYVARELSGLERALWWDRAVTVWPDYAEYQTRTEHQIPRSGSGAAHPASITNPTRAPWMSRLLRDVGPLRQYLAQQGHGLGQVVSHGGSVPQERHAGGHESAKSV